MNAESNNIEGMRSEGVDSSQTIEKTIGLQRSDTVGSIRSLLEERGVLVGATLIHKILALNFAAKLRLAGTERTFASQQDLLDEVVKRAPNMRHLGALEHAIDVAIPKQKIHAAENAKERDAQNHHSASRAGWARY